MTDFFGDYAPYAPKLATEYRTDMDHAVDEAMHDPHNYKEKFEMSKFEPIQVLVILA